MNEVLALGIGYLLGSVLPADLLARRRGVDIRGVGTRNPGATNALRELGLVPGLITGAYDASVGIVSMYVASLLGVSDGWMYAAGAAAVVGHCLPVFFGFHGGQGMAATTGLLVYEIVGALRAGWLSPAGMTALSVIALAVFLLTRSGTLVGVVAAPLLAGLVIAGSADAQLTVFMVALAGYIWAVQLLIARRNHLLRLARHRIGGPDARPRGAGSA